jgi:hypothetical protein
MSWFNQIAIMLKQYTSGGAAAAPAPDVHAHFDQVAQAAPKGVIAEGLVAAFRSDRTPAFGEMLSTLFSNSNGDQKAGMLNQLLSSVHPGMLAQVLGIGLTSGGKPPELTPEQAQQVSPEQVQQLAAHAASSNPSVVESVSSFYAQHGTLVKTLGGTALSVLLAKIAQRGRQA